MMTIRSRSLFAASFSALLAGTTLVPGVAFAQAKPTEHNAYKLPLVERTLAATLAQARK